MGTSQSGKGPGPNVPIIPPWVPETDEPSKDDNGQNNETPREGDNPNDAPLIAPPARFSNSRRNLSSFARTGDVGDLKKSVGHYFNKGYGGAKAATRRLAGTTKTAASLYSTLSAVSSGQSTNDLDVELLKGRSPQEVIDILVEAIRPIDGTQDSEIARTSLNEALSELLEIDENVDLLNLTEDQKIQIIEKYLSLDVFGRFQMDLGEIVIKNAPSLPSALSRLKDVKDYIKEVVSSAFRKAHNSSGKVTSASIGNIVRSALQDAINVFEEYIV